MKYFIDTEIYSQGKKQPPRKVIIISTVFTTNTDGTTTVLAEELRVSES